MHACRPTGSQTTAHPATRVGNSYQISDGSAGFDHAAARPDPDDALRGTCVSCRNQASFSTPGAALGTPGVLLREHSSGAPLGSRTGGSPEGGGRRRIPTHPRGSRLRADPASAERPRSRSHAGGMINRSAAGSQTPKRRGVLRDGRVGVGLGDVGGIRRRERAQQQARGFLVNGGSVAHHRPGHVLARSPRCGSRTSLLAGGGWCRSTQSVISSKARQ